MSEGNYNNFTQNREEFAEHKERLILSFQDIIEASKNFRFITHDRESSRLRSMFQSKCDIILNDIIRKLDNPDDISFFESIVTNVLVPILSTFNGLDYILMIRQEREIELKIAGVSPSNIESDPQVLTNSRDIVAINEKIESDGMNLLDSILLRDDSMSEQEPLQSTE